MKKTTALLICILILFTYMPGAYSADGWVTVYGEDFSGYAVGDGIDGTDNWTEVKMSGSESSTLVYCIEKNNGSNAVAIRPSGLGTMKKRLAWTLDRPLSGKVNISFDVTRTTANTNFYFDMLDENQTRFSNMYYDNAKQRMYIKYRNQNDEEVSDGGRSTQFGTDRMNISFSVDFDNCTLSTSYGKNITALKKSLSLAEIRFYNPDSEPKGVIYIDNVKIESYYENIAEKLLVGGSSRIYGRNGAETVFSYTAHAVASDGGAANSEIVWSASGLPENVSLDSENGRITVSGAVREETAFTVTARDIISGISCDKNIVIMPESVYNRDRARLGAVKTAIDNALVYGRDIYSGSPLLADGYDTVNGTPAIWKLPDGTEIAMSNLANQANLMMSMDILSAVTDDDTYKNKVRSIYKYFLDNLVTEKNGLPVWGGHATVDLHDMQKKGHEGAIYHELKNHMPYFQPFFDIDADRASNIVKGIWDSHVSDWSTLTFNRHGKYRRAGTVSQTWENPDIYDTSTEGILIESNQELPLRNAANDMLHAAFDLYENTGSEKALLWSERLLGRYNALADPDTKIGVYQFVQPKMVEDPMKVLEPIGAWNKIKPVPNEYTTSHYGDRAKNQFEQQFVEDGIITDAEREKIREAYFVGNGVMYRDSPLQDFRLAEILGTDTAAGKKILKSAIEGMAAYARYAYIPETNKFKYILSSGIDLTGYTLKTGGYYGDIGKTIQAANVEPAFMISYARGCELCGDDPELAEDKKQLWQVVRGIGRAYGLGDFGEDITGGAVLNQDTDCDEPYFIEALIELYRTTGNRDYLNLARRIADNIVKNKFDGRFFTSSPKNRYIRFSDCYCYFLLMLEAELAGIGDEIPPFELCEPYFQCDIMYEDGSTGEKRNDYDVFWNIEKPMAIPDNAASYMDEDFSDKNTQASQENNGIIRYSNDEAVWSVVDAKGQSSLSSTALSASVSTESDGNGVLRIKRNATASQPGIQRPMALFNSNSENLNEDVYISMRIKPEKLNTTLSLYINNTDGTRVAWVDIAPDGKITCKSGENSIKRNTTGTVTSGEWAELVIEMDVGNKIYNLYLDGKRISGTEADFLVPSDKGIGAVLFDLARSGYTAESVVLFDDIFVGDTEKNVFAVTDAGLTKNTSVSVKAINRPTADADIYIACYDTDGRLCALSAKSAGSDCARVNKVNVSNTDCEKIKAMAFEHGTLKPVMKTYESK